MFRGLRILAVVALAGCDSSLKSPTTPSLPGEGVTSGLSNSEQGIVDGTNAERARFGVPKLSSNAALDRAAALTAAQLVSSGVFAHDIDGVAYPHPADRLTAAGYKYTAWGENIGKGSTGTTVAAMVTAWINSPEHHDNMVRASFSDIGVAIATAPNGTVYMVQEFGHQ